MIVNCDLENVRQGSRVAQTKLHDCSHWEI